ncbi:testis-expressed protein 10 [Adelges cooleyi]|uniref:testis-expressed protein 10 n=1 Tax=Adelges cooleyi TaxID=133065 RepID=UPI0021806CD3|nr:testis-expressed protein 10 [Adelges cooleyi]
MVKSGHKKFLKKEKSKVKLKISHKTLLPKGQNVTDTNFKVKKIVLQGQLRERGEHEILSKGNLNIKELLTRLNHHNLWQRQSALEGLNDLVAFYPPQTMAVHLSSFLEAASRLTLDCESDIRKLAVKLLSSVLSAVNEEQVAPSFEIVTRYLACAMSHINSAVRETSLKVLEVLIEKNPKLTATHCQSVVLPGFLDLISSKLSDTGSRKLTIQINDQSSTSVWRLKVLNSLRSLLSAVVENTSQESKSSVVLNRTVNWKDSCHLCVPLYNEHSFKVAPLDLNIKRMCEVNSSMNEIQKYTVSLMPLLIDTFLEVAPGKRENKNSSELSVQTVSILKCIIEIILLLWKIFQHSDNPSELMLWFSDSYGDKICQTFFSTGFPYYMLNTGGTTDKVKKHKTDADVVLDLFGDSMIQNDSKCTKQNIDLCLVYLLLSKYKVLPVSIKTISIYINDLLDSYKQLEHHSFITLMHCLEVVLDNGNANKVDNVFDLNAVIDKLVGIHNDMVVNDGRHRHEKTKLVFNFLCSIASKPYLKMSEQVEEYSNWLTLLPEFLCQRRVPYHIVKALSNVARYNLPQFTKSLNLLKPAILDNVDIIADNKADKIEGQTMLKDIMYTVFDWEKEIGLV